MEAGPCVRATLGPLTPAFYARNTFRRPLVPPSNGALIPPACFPPLLRSLAAQIRSEAGQNTVELSVLPEVSRPALVVPRNGSGIGVARPFDGQKVPLTTVAVSALAMNGDRLAPSLALPRPSIRGEVVDVQTRGLAGLASPVHVA